MPVLHAARALTPEGWKSDVRVTIDGGAIAAVKRKRQRRRGTSVTRSWRPAARTCTATPSSAPWPASPKSGATENDTFWTWRETMYRFALMMSPDDVEAVAAQLYVEMLEAGFAAVGRVPLPPSRARWLALREPAEMAGRISAAARRVGIGMTLLPVFYAHSTFRRRAAQAGAEAVHLRPPVIRAPRRRLPRDDQGG